MASESKAVIVTGAASGIGLAMAIALLTEGHNVVAVDRNSAALDGLAAQAAGLRGRVSTLTADLAHPDAFAQVTAAALAAPALQHVIAGWGGLR